MKYNQLGKWGVKVSALGIGSYLNVSHKSTSETSKNMIKLAYDNGINFIDTADVYGEADKHGMKGQAEIELGSILKEYRRESLFIITKLFFDVGPGINDRGLSAKHIKEGVEGSLKRLKMDYLDVMMCHRPDPETPIEETVRAMEDMIRQGKILYWGTSMWSSEQIQLAQDMVRQLNARPISVNEPSYNLLNREPEKGVFETTYKEGIGNVTYSPLANGMLTGKYKPGMEPPKGTRAAEDDINGFMKQAYYNEDNKIKCQEFTGIATEMGVRPSQLAIAWCLRRKEVSSVIVGARREEQLSENIKSIDIKIPEDVQKRLDLLFPLI